MPQMSPMWWTLLFILFNLTFMVMNSMLYFNTTEKMKKTPLLKTKNMNWTW